MNIFTSTIFFMVSKHNQIVRLLNFVAEAFDVTKIFAVGCTVYITVAYNLRFIDSRSFSVG